MHERSYPPGFTEVVTEWVNGLRPVIQRIPSLKKVDLVIEGGWGGDNLMSHIAFDTFPGALYVGTDICEAIMESSFDKQRLSGAVDSATVQEIIAANAQRAYAMRDALVYGNCFDGKLISDLMAKLSRERPILVTFNGLGALEDTIISQSERKRQEDRYPIRRWFVSDMPYIAHMHVTHLGVDWKRSDNKVNGVFWEVAQAAEKAGWQVQRFIAGIIAVKPSV